MEKKCQCGGNMNKGEFMSFGGASVRVPNGYNYPKDYLIIPFVCDKCGKVEFYASDNNQNGNFMFGGIIIG